MDYNFFSSGYLPWKKKNGPISFEKNDALAQVNHGRDKSFNILLVGISDAGKTTFFNQFVKIFSEKDYFDEEYLKSLRPRILFEIVEGIMAVWTRAKQIGEDLGEDLEITATQIESIYNACKKQKSLEQMTFELREQILKLYDSALFKVMLEQRRSEFLLSDGWSYLILRLKDDIALCHEGWRPSFEDILHVREPTSNRNDSKAINVEDFTVQLIDTGISSTVLNDKGTLFAGINVVMFVHPLSCYNEQNPRNPSENRFKMSYDLWEKLCGHVLFQNSMFYIVFSKRDVFDEKYLGKKIPLNNFSGFVDDPPPPPDLAETSDDAINWFTKIFMESVTEKRRKRLQIKKVDAFNSQKCKKFLTQVIQSLYNL